MNGKNWNLVVALSVAVLAPLGVSAPEASAMASALDDADLDVHRYIAGDPASACNTVIAGHGLGGVCYPPGHIGIDPLNGGEITVEDDNTGLVSISVCRDDDADGCDGGFLNIACSTVHLDPRFASPAWGYRVIIEFVPFGVAPFGWCPLDVLPPTTGTILHT